MDSAKKEQDKRAMAGHETNMTSGEVNVPNVGASEENQTDHLQHENEQTSNEKQANQSITANDISKIQLTNVNNEENVKSSGEIEKFTGKRPLNISENKKSPEEEVKPGKGFHVLLHLLPSEIILHIVSFLDAKFVICTLSKVCTTFHSLVNDSGFWKARILRRWPKKYPAIPLRDNEEFDWKQACIERETELRRWTSVATSMDYFTFKEGLYGAVDSVHLMQEGRLLAVGSRDRYLNILDVTKFDKTDPNSSVSCRTLCKDNAHDGWIWSMSSCNSVLATGSWDTRVKFWDLTTMTEINVAKAQSAILCSHFEPDFYVAGGYDKNVYHFDPRTSVMQLKKCYHNKPVLCLAMNGDHIFTGSEDSTVALFDRRAAAVVRRVKLPQYSISMSYDDGQLWVGDKAGSIHLIDSRSGDLKLVKTYSSGHTQKVMGIIHRQGAMFTCSTDRTVRVYEPSLDPGLIANLTDINSEVAEISYQNGVLACACSGMFVGVYRPKDAED